jgi:hypothetical protein
MVNQIGTQQRKEQNVHLIGGHAKSNKTAASNDSDRFRQLGAEFFMPR